ncbi:hypothetical protein RRG08_033718 [Elysia crispata]|uniref:Uncharacterized protein n=1 Tax=Elysia crispata TaxID=231223 RepID=A0AAE1AAI4_9GAST|nr:hypothetical protein RRG08_033718 [Elysia crispata]
MKRKKAWVAKNDHSSAGTSSEVMRNRDVELEESNWKLCHMMRVDSCALFVFRDGSVTLTTKGEQASNDAIPPAITAPQKEHNGVIWGGAGDNGEARLSHQNTIICSDTNCSQIPFVLEVFEVIICQSVPVYLSPSSPFPCPIRRRYSSAVPCSRLPQLSTPPVKSNECLRQENTRCPKAYHYPFLWQMTVPGTTGILKLIHYFVMYTRREDKGVHNVFYIELQILKAEGSNPPGPPHTRFTLQGRLWQVAAKMIFDSLSHILENLQAAAANGSRDEPGEEIQLGRRDSLPPRKRYGRADELDTSPSGRYDFQQSPADVPQLFTPTLNKDSGSSPSIEEMSHSLVNLVDKGQQRGVKEHATSVTIRRQAVGILPL